MSKIRQFYADKAKTTKLYPKNIAKAIGVKGGGTVQDYMDGTKSVKKAESADKANKAIGLYSSGNVSSSNTVFLAWNDGVVTVGVDNAKNLAVQYANIANFVPWNGLTGCPFQEIAFVYLSFSNFQNSNCIIGTLNVGAKWDGCRVFLTQAYNSGSPMSTVTNLIGRVVGGVLTVYAYGQFVNGHIICADVFLKR